MRLKNFEPVFIGEVIGCYISSETNDLLVFGEIKMSTMQFSEVNKFKPVSIGEVIGCTIFW